MLQETAAAPGRARRRSPDRGLQRGASLPGRRAAATADDRAARHRARARRPQHRAGHRAGRARRAAAADERRSAAAGAARRPRDPRRRRLPRGGARGARAARRPGSSSPSASCASAPETGYGYIQRGAPQGAAFRDRALRREADRRAGARQFVASGDYYWNSGMFLFRARRYLAGARALRARHRAHAASRRSRGAKADLDFTRIDAGAVRSLPQRLDRLRGDGEDRAMPWWCRSMPAGATSAPGLRCTTASERTRDGNVAARRRASARTPQDCYLYSESRLVAAVGLDDHVVVETKDAVLVAPQDAGAGREEAGGAPEGARAATSTPCTARCSVPGAATTASRTAPRFQVKRLTVKPGGVLSLQMHHHRAEHWIVVSGTARITRGEEVFLLEENQSTYIPIGVQASDREPGQDAAAHHRGAVRRLPRRGRHRALRGSATAARAPRSKDAS